MLPQDKLKVSKSMCLSTEYGSPIFFSRMERVLAVAERVGINAQSIMMGLDRLKDTNLPASEYLKLFSNIDEKHITPLDRMLRDERIVSTSLVVNDKEKAKRSSIISGAYYTSQTLERKILRPETGNVLILTELVTYLESCPNENPMAILSKGYCSPQIELLKAVERSYSKDRFTDEPMATASDSRLLRMYQERTWEEKASDASGMIQVMGAFAMHPEHSVRKYVKMMALNFIRLYSSKEEIDYIKSLKETLTIAQTHTGCEDIGMVVSSLNTRINVHTRPKELRTRNPEIDEVIKYTGWNDRVPTRR